ncbi:hypothetical protein K443DRAFT_109059 [Laccaria amethystina LaAM-08-1]|uniref:Uncharacterized protein n=1 Tax=Laccaria amethystina LaAM-08-1 TaxID=1095629 RepID=A0A0C9WTH4_9AGAR|nr:hypothetical protein K443DRAFT_109059 [Laccaria amethystina LaAM-08-1]
MPEIRKTLYKGSVDVHGCLSGGWGCRVSQEQLPLEPPRESSVEGLCSSLSTLHCTCGAQELLVDPLPQGAKREGALYLDGAHITDLKVVH